MVAWSFAHQYAPSFELSHGELTSTATAIDVKAARARRVDLAERCIVEVEVVVVVLLFVFVWELRKVRWLLRYWSGMYQMDHLLLFVGCRLGHQGLLGRKLFINLYSIDWVCRGLYIPCRPLSGKRAAAFLPLILDTNAGREKGSKSLHSTEECTKSLRPR
jgi:hypothetical protein